MTTKAQLRKAATGQPEAQETTRDGLPTFSVLGKEFASLSPEGTVHLHLPEERVTEAVTAHPAGESITQAGRVTGFAIALKDINGMHLNNLVHAAWAHRAPRGLTAARQSDAVDHDLPRAIGRPATGALLLAGISTLAEVGNRTDEELLALHGVGPRAVRILREALATQS